MMLVPLTYLESVDHVPAIVLVSKHRPSNDTYAQWSEEAFSLLGTPTGLYFRFSFLMLTTSFGDTGCPGIVGVGTASSTPKLLGRWLWEEPIHLSLLLTFSFPDRVTLGGPAWS